MSNDKLEWVIVGLGNPGKKYEVTRHNLGFLVVKALARRLGLGFKEERSFSAYSARAAVDGQVVHLLLPTTYMNNSGMAVRRYLDYYKLAAEQLVVVADDVALDFGTLRLRPGGSAGGHNGLRSIQEQMGTTEYIRLRMGIGDHRRAEEPQASLADYVLGDFTQGEVIQLEEFIDQGAQVLLRLLKEPIGSVMNSANGANPTKKINENPAPTGQEKKHE